VRAFSKIESSEYTNLNKVIGWFITLRWIACFGVFLALLIVYFKYDFNIPYKMLFTLNSILFFVNLLFTIYYYFVKFRNFSRKEMSVIFHAQVCSDYILLFLLIYFTGFLENPFSYYFVFHIMLTSLIFSSMLTFMYVGILIAVIITVSLLEMYAVIPHFSLFAVGASTYKDLLIMRAAGLCTTLIFSAYLITSIKNLIEERGLKVEVELNRYKSLDKIKSNFILQVTHELRGPLAALKGYHEMILKGITGDINDRTKDTIKKADRRTQNLLTIIDEMIDYSYMKSEEEVKFDKTEIRVKDVIDYNLDIMQNMAQEKGLHFVSNCSKELVLLTNRDLLNIILTNLISNAVRYSPSGTTVTVNAEQDRGDIHFLVKDEGMGMQSGELDKIFEEFYRSRRAREIERDGTGLGLSIVKKAVESLNGRMTVYSEEGKGTAFHIYFPRSTSQSNLKFGG
jgi:signal transduction histidine kinase